MTNMSTFGFIVLILIIASFFATGLVILAAVMASRSTARLAAQYPEIYNEEVLADAQRRAEALRAKNELKPTARQIAVH
jgi:hypothetical protein